MRKKTKGEFLQGRKGSTKKKLSLQKTVVKTSVKRTSAAQDKYFKAIFDNAGIGVILLDSNRKILKANHAVLKSLKYTEDELTSIPLNNIIHPDDLEANQKLFKEIVSGRKKQNTIEKRYISKDDKIVYGRITLSLISDPKRKKKQILVLIENLTTQKHIEKRLNSEQNFLHALLESSSDHIYFKDLNSCFYKVSNALAKRHGFKSDQLVGKSDFDIFGPNHARDAYADEQEIIRSGKPIIEKEEREDLPDGRIIWVSTSKIPLLDSSGNIIGTFGISRDITSRKRSERIREALFQISEMAYTTSDMNTLYKKIHEVISELMPAKNIFIALYNERTDVLSFPYNIDENDQMKESSKRGRGLTEYVLRTGKAILIDYEKFWELAKKGEIENVETPPLIWLGVPLKLFEKTFGVIAVRDYNNPKAYNDDDMQILTFVSEQIAQVIERKRNSEEIKRYTEELKQSNNTKDKFFSIIAHDLKNPFITLLGFSELLLSDYADLSDDERIYYIQEMKKSADISHNLLQNLLQWSRSQTGRIEFNPHDVDLLKLVSGIIELLKATAEKKEINMTYNISPGLFVVADEDMLNTIIRNLLTNSLKFTRKGGLVSVEAELNGNYVNISVKDTGVGMCDKVRQNLFRMDVSQSTFGTDNEAGTGLGLLLCKEFIEKHGGKITVQSELDKGSIFKFNLGLGNITKN
jgi:PAS domain S-box-containing protein